MKTTKSRKRTVRAWGAFSRVTGNLINVWNTEPSDYQKADPQVEYHPISITYTLPTTKKKRV